MFKRYLSLLILAAMYALLFAVGDYFLLKYEMPFWTGLVLPLALLALQFWLGPAILEWLLNIWWHDDRLPVRNVRFLEAHCEQHRMPLPRLGVVECALPNAFTFGHTKNDARIVVTSALIAQLDEDELNAVLAHELGHIVHRDFAVMTAARVVPLLLYQIYAFSRRQSSHSALAWGAYVAYWISEFAVLLLSRTREYAADAFAADATQKPGAMASALVKICYGLATAKTELDRATMNGSPEEKAAALRQRNLGAAIGCMGIAHAAGASSISLHSTDPAVAAAAMKWEWVNPWAKVYESLSTHPLTSRRVAAMNRRMTSEEVVYPVPSGLPREWTRFPYELFLWAAPWALTSAALGSGGLWLKGRLPIDLTLSLVTAAAVAWLLRITYRYAEGFQDATVANLVTNTQASQMNSLPVRLTGRITGTAAPRETVCPDLVLEDETGRVYVSYQPFIPFMDFTFAECDAPKYVGNTVVVEGWLRRGPVPFLEMKSIRNEHGDKMVTHKKWIQSALVLVGLVVALFYQLRA